MACRYAKFDEDDWYVCKVTGESCRFITPNSSECARRFKEGPEVKVKMNTYQTSLERNVR